MEWWFTICINLAIAPSDRIVVGRVLKQFLRGGLKPLGGKQAGHRCA